MKLEVGLENPQVYRRRKKRTLSTVHIHHFLSFSCHIYLFVVMALSAFSCVSLLVFHFNARRNFSVTVRRDLMRAKYLSLASTSVQRESGVLVFSSISSAAVM